ncbi:hypothetical protein MGLY_05230 [Neomoorella glycerini]|uniref:Uncharacterized protein n=1 Tax=Neomoorella glycerini TaxID=55779 RepID=A0A6I5ZMX5_9FIRM|nr:hypothetical protein MGLY_05230 [Moorella glycerini]
MKKRLEVVILGELSEKAKTLRNHFPQGKLCKEVTVDELLGRWKGEIELLRQLSSYLFPTK